MIKSFLMRYADYYYNAGWLQKLKGGMLVLSAVFDSDDICLIKSMYIPSSVDHFRIVSIRPGWAHSQRRVGVNITIPLH